MIPRLKFAHLPLPLKPCRVSAKFSAVHACWSSATTRPGLLSAATRPANWNSWSPRPRPGGRHAAFRRGAAVQPLPPNGCRSGKIWFATAFLCWLESLQRKPVPTCCSTSFLERRSSGSEKSRRDAVLQETFEKTSAQGRKPYLVPYGGSSPTGALGYVFAMEEFIGQKVKADWIVFASSSGGTQAGLVLGAVYLVTRAGAGHQHRRAAAHPARARGKTGLRDERTAGAADRVCLQTRYWSMMNMPPPVTGS